MELTIKAFERKSGDSFYVIVKDSTLMKGLSAPFTIIAKGVHEQYDYIFDVRSLNWKYMFGTAVIEQRRR